MVWAGIRPANARGDSGAGSGSGTDEDLPPAIPHKFRGIGEEPEVGSGPLAFAPWGWTVMLPPTGLHELSAKTEKHRDAQE